MNESSVRSKLSEVLDLVVSDVNTVRTGRAKPSLVEDLTVVVYGGTTKLRIQEVATVSSPDPESIVISPYDKSIIGEIKKGIEAANIGFSPNIDGEIIRISVPPLTTEDREKLVKILSGKLESGKIMIRQVRGDVMKDIKKEFEEKTITEDEKFMGEKRLQMLVDEFVKKIEEAGEQKKKELLQI
ncbi:ribosome recycling factor [Candidatus Woesebacteria bacterium]|nr:MAG: ribosome recycling factor [Candidatus Woesebacteria bacterium]